MSSVLKQTYLNNTIKKFLRKEKNKGNGRSRERHDMKEKEKYLLKYEDLNIQVSGMQEA